VQTAWTGPNPTVRRPLSHYLAAAGVLCLVWEGWTLIAWIADGPQAITQFRDTSHYTWWLARVLEGAAVLLAIITSLWLWRSSRSGRRVSFDVMFVVAGFLGFWTDPMVNFIQPIWLYNSNFINVGSWAGHIPFVLNPAADKVPEPIVFGPLVYAFGILVFALLMERVGKGLLRRRPTMSKRQLWARLVIVAMGIDLALELPLLLTGMERMAGFPSWFSIGGHSPTKFAVVELIGVSLLFSGLALLRMSRNDRGETIVERGLAPGRRGRFISLLALIGVFNLGMFAVNGALAISGLYADHYPDNPPYLINDVCGPGTDYGPCPGTPGYAIPLK
jgi:hypothetical protein